MLSETKAGESKLSAVAIIKTENISIIRMYLVLKVSRLSCVTIYEQGQQPGLSELGPRVNIFSSYHTMSPKVFNSRVYPSLMSAWAYMVRWITAPRMHHAAPHSSPLSPNLVYLRCQGTTQTAGPLLSSSHQTDFLALQKQILNHISWLDSDWLESR